MFRIAIVALLMLAGVAHGAVYNNIGNVKVDDIQYSSTAAMAARKTFPNYSTLQTIGRGGDGGIAVNDFVTGGPWIDIRRYGATVNSSTDDDATAINAAINASSGKAVVVAGGTYHVATPIVIKNGTHLVIASGATIQAKAGFVGSYVITTDTTVATNVWTEWWSLSGGGTIDAANLVDTTVNVYVSRFAKIHDLSIKGGKLHGLLMGDLTAHGQCYETDLYNVRVYYNDVANLPGSIGVYHRRCPDSFVRDVYVIGYRVGFRASGYSGSVDYSQTHAWVRPVHGPFTHAYFNEGGANTFTQCYADAPTPGGDGTITDVYGFYMDSFDWRITDSRVYSNTYVGEDNTVTGVRINKTNSYGKINGLKLFAEDDTVKFKAFISGDTGKLVTNGISHDGRAYDAVVKHYYGINQNIFERGVEFSSEVTFDTTSIFTGVPTFNAAPLFNGVSPLIRGAAATNRDILYQTGTSNRWALRTNTATESGSNAGSDFFINRYDDAGVYISTPVEISRANGRIKINDVPVYADNTAATAGGLSAGQIYRTSTGTLMIRY